MLGLFFLGLPAELGTALEQVGAAHEGNPYAEWIKTYASSDFQKARRKLEDLLDVLTTAAEAQDRPDEVKALPTLYRKAMELEFDFFHAQAVASTWPKEVLSFAGKLGKTHPKGIFRPLAEL